jgi:ligand-binding sensor domain-containing protein
MDVLSIITLESGMLAGTWNGFYQSSDEGATWLPFTPTGIPADAPIWCIEKVNATLYAGMAGAVYASTDNGATWNVTGSGIAADARVTSLVAREETLFAATASHGVYKWTIGGTSWTAINTSLTDKHISQLVALDDQLVALTLTGVFISSNGGTSWATDTSGLKKVNCMVTVNDRVIAGTDGNGAFLLDDDSVSWKTFNMGMPADARIWSLAINRDGIFAGTSSGIWFLSSPNTVSGVKDITVPTTVRLEQNYPNPVKTSTTISFYVPSNSFVTLKVYDMQGREVATLVAEETAQGYYSRKWDAAGLPSGIYLYRLQAGSFSETKRLILLP